MTTIHNPPPKERPKNVVFPPTFLGAYKDVNKLLLETLKDAEKALERGGIFNENEYGWLQEKINMALELNKQVVLIHRKC